MKYLIIICIAFIAASAVIKPGTFTSTIYGNVEPPDACEKVFAIKGTDTVAIIPEAGKFSIAVSGAGTWKLYVRAISPYKDAILDNVHVEEGKSTDAGIITLVSK